MSPSHKNKSYFARVKPLAGIGAIRSLFSACVSQLFLQGDNRGVFNLKTTYKTQAKNQKTSISSSTPKMKQKTKENYKEKDTFKETFCCPQCKQKKSCGVLDQKKNYCCSCYRKILEELEWEQLLISSAQQLLNDYRQRVIICQCLESEKVRVRYLNYDGSGWTRCERCEKMIESAGHHGVVKNRNDPKFWEVESEWKILCLKCLGKNYYQQLSPSKRKTFNKYVKRGYA